MGRGGRAVEARRPQQDQIVGVDGRDDGRGHRPAVGQDDLRRGVVGEDMAVGDQEVVSHNDGARMRVVCGDPKDPVGGRAHRFRCVACGACTGGLCRGGEERQNDDDPMQNHGEMMATARGIGKPVTIRL